MKLYILIVLLLILSGCIGVKTGDDSDESSLFSNSYTSADIIFPENDKFLLLSPQKSSNFKRNEIKILDNNSNNINSFIIDNNIIKLYNITPGWYSVYIDNSLKFKIKAFLDAKVYSFISYSNEIQDNGYIYITQNISSYSISNFSSSLYGHEINKLSYSCKGTINNNIFISTDIKIYKNNSSEQITENMIDNNSANINTYITTSNFSEISEDHRKKILNIITGKTEGYQDYSSFNAKLNENSVEIPKINSISLLENNSELNSLKPGQKIKTKLIISNKNKISIKVFNQNKMIYEENNIESNDSNFILNEFIIKNSYIENNKITFIYIIIDNNGNIASKDISLNAESSSKTIDYYFSLSGTKIINNNITFNIDTTKNSTNTSLKTPISNGYFYIDIKRTADEKRFYLDSFESSLNYYNYYFSELSNMKTLSNGIYYSIKKFKEYGEYKYSYFLEDNNGDTSEIRYGVFKIAKDNDSLLDTTIPEFYINFRNQYGGDTIFYDSSNEITIDTTKTSSGIENSNIEKNLNIYVKITRNLDGLYSEKWKEMSSLDGIYRSNERIKEEGYFNIRIAAVDLSGNTYVQNSNSVIFIGKTDKIAPVFEVTITDENNDEDINVGDKVKLSIVTTPNEGQAYLRAEVSASGETRSIYDEKLITFDDKGNFIDVSSKQITSSYENSNLVGVKFDIVVYLKDIAGNETVKFIPSIIKE